MRGDSRLLHSAVHLEIRHEKLMSLNIVPAQGTSADSLVVWKAFQQGDAWMMTHKELEYPLFL